MSLRAELHDAIDEIAPAAPWLPHQVEEFVLSNGRVRQDSGSHRRRWTARLRGSLALVAGLLIVVLAAGIPVGARLWSDWETTHSSAAAAQRQWDQLRGRPLELPVVQAGDACPAEAFSSLPGWTGRGTAPVVYGSGPVYLHSNERVGTAWGAYFTTVYFPGPGFAGPVLVRGRDLVTGQPVVFADVAALGYAGAGGPVVGTDSVLGHPIQQREELDLDPAAAYAAMTSKGVTYWVVLQGIPTGGSGCVGLQIDTSAGTETVVVSYPT